MAKATFLVIIIALFLIVVFCFWLNKNKMETAKVCFQDHCFLAEVAKTQAQRTKGLMFRKSLAQDRAMLFVFDKPWLYNFWMKNCQIPLDIIWLDESYKVVAIRQNNPPCPQIGDCPSINPNVSARYVLEINAGLSSQLGLTEGSYFTINLDKGF